MSDARSVEHTNGVYNAQWTILWLIRKEKESQDLIQITEYMEQDKRQGVNY